MSLLSRTKQLLASGNLSAALVITALPATLASAQVSISNDAKLSFPTDSSGISSGTYSNFISSVTDNVLSFNISIGNGTTDTDATMFGLGNLSRQSYVDIYGHTSGTFAVDEMIRFTYTITTTLLGGSTTSVSYTGYAFIADDGTSYLNTFMGDNSNYSSGYITSVNLGTGSNSNLSITGTTDEGGNLHSYVFKNETTMSYSPGTYGIHIAYDWDVESLPGLNSSYSSSEILSMNITGTMSLVPEPASSGLLGAAGALGTAFFFRRRKNRLANRGAFT